MTKILTLKIESCEDCFYLDKSIEANICRNPNTPRKFPFDVTGIPHWCPLPDLEKGPVWGDADWGMEEEKDGR